MTEQRQLSDAQFYKLQNRVLQRTLAELAMKQALENLARCQQELGFTDHVVVRLDERTKIVTLGSIDVDDPADHFVKSSREV